MEAEVRLVVCTSPCLKFRRVFGAFLVTHERTRAAASLLIISSPFVYLRFGNFICRWANFNTLVIIAFFFARFHAAIEASIPFRRNDRYIMKPLVSFISGLAATTIIPLITAAEPIKQRQELDIQFSCDSTTAQLCPGCDGGNYTDAAGQDWAVSCDWAVDAEDEALVGGKTTTESCLNACEDSPTDDCFAVNFAANGSCMIATGEQKGIAFSPGFTNLFRVASITVAGGPTSTSRLQVTVTTTPAGSTRPLPAPFTSLASAPSPSSTGMSGQCDLSAEPEDICPKCHGEVAVDINGAAYRVFCDTSLDSDGSYSVQEWLSPFECLEECDKLDFCTGATYSGDRNCELAKANPAARYDANNTALLPVLTPEPTPSPTSSMRLSRAQAWNSSLTTPPPGPTATILPIDSGCDASAMTCPQCDGAPATDGLGGNYTALCGLEPSCLTTDRQDPTSQQSCLQLCADDATCLGAMWFPDSQNCNLCLRGMSTSRVAGDLQFVLFAVDQDGEDDFNSPTIPTSNSTALNSTTTRGVATLPPPMTRSITDFPRPFSTVLSASIGPVGPVSVASLPNITSTTASVSLGGPVFFNASSTAIPATVDPAISATPVTCPGSDNHVFVDPDSDNYFAVGCGSRFDAAHSRFVSASNFEACAASCTGACDGVQWGYVTRCGLYTDISVVGPAAGWTVAASITPPAATPVPATLTSVDVSAIVSSTAAPSFAASATTRLNITIAAQVPTSSADRAAPLPYSAGA